VTPLDAIILGVVEGITEYLPVSSTGHLIITAWLLGLDRPPETKAAVDAFNVIVQGGAILAVLGLYRKRVAQMIRGILGRDPIGRRLAINIVVAFLPAAVFGLLLASTIERHLFHPWPVIAALAIGGVLLIVIGPWQRRLYAAQADRDPDSTESDPRFLDIESLTWRRALVIGLLQCVAMWPGTSRSMMSIVGGMLVGMKPRDAAEFSFLLGLPTLGGACIYKLATTLHRDGVGFIDDLGGWFPVLLAIFVAMLSAALAIKWLVGYLSRHGMSIFGWYRLALCAFLIWLVLGMGLDFGGE